MKRIRAAFIVLLSAATAALVAASFTFSWLSGAVTDLEMDGLHGGIISQYFHCGSGTEQDPYVITKPVHLYNLTMLYENLDGFAEQKNHFQLGYNLDGNDGLEFYSYNDEGIYQNGYSTRLNMGYYDAFVPIGSAEKPFRGVFDGSGLILDNLNVSGSGVSDIGVFGFVTDEAKIKDLYIDNLTIDVTGAVTNAHATHSHACVGYIAGHIEDASCVTETYVNNCEITGKSVLTKNDWGYFGKCDNAATLQAFVANAAEGEEEGWGGSINFKNYTNLLYDLNHSTTETTTNTFSGDGGYVVTKTASATSDPNNNHVVYRLRDGSYIPLKFQDADRTKAALGNTGYLIGSNVGTDVNASPKISSYKMVNLQNALTNTKSTDMSKTYKADNIGYSDNKLEIMTYKSGWKRIKDSHNEGNNSTNQAITSYTKTNLADFGFVKYADSRNALQEVLESSPFLHGIHFDNNAVSTSNLLTVPANTIRVNGKRVTTSYQLPKGSIDFNLKEEGLINFFAGTYNSSQVNLNFFSLYQVTRNDNGSITALTQIKKIYQATSGEGYVYQTGNSKPSGAGSLLFDVETVLHGNAPVINMMYYFEIPVNAGEYAMGVAGSTQGAYMIYLDLGANAGQGPGLVDDFGSVEYRSTPDTASNSILLITYSQGATNNLEIAVIYDDTRKRYDVICTGDAIEVTVTILSTAYTVYFNSLALPNEIGSYPNTPAT